MMLFLKSIGLKTWAYIAAFFTIVGIAAKIYKAGGQANDIERLNKTIDSVMRGDKIEDDVERLSDDDVADELRRNNWTK